MSFLLQAAVAVFAALGVVFSIAEAGAQVLLYFTVQSNLWMGAVCAIFFVFRLIGAGKSRCAIPRVLWRFKFVFTVSITLTGVVFCCVLAPTVAGAFDSAANVLTHVVVPRLSAADLFVAGDAHSSGKDLPFALLPPLYYVVFAGIGYACRWDFGRGARFPYFFLNWGSPVGAFGFGGEGVYFMGCGWWLIALSLFLIGIAAVYVALLQKIPPAESSNK